MLAPPPEADGAGGTGQARRGGSGLPAPAPPPAEVIWRPRGGWLRGPKVQDGDSGRWGTVLAECSLLLCERGRASNSRDRPGWARGAAPETWRSPLLPRSPGPWRFAGTGGWRNATRTGSASCVRPGFLDAEPNNCVFLRSAHFLRLIGRAEFAAYLRRSHLRRAYLRLRRRKGKIQPEGPALQPLRIR